VAGLDARQAYSSQWSGSDVENSFGLQVRTTGSTTALPDRRRARVENLIPHRAYLRHHGSGLLYGHPSRLYAENKVQWTDKFRSVLAMRGDLDYFDVTSLVTRPTTAPPHFVASPKLI